MGPRPDDNSENRLHRALALTAFRLAKQPIADPRPDGYSLGVS